jgi:hypothetical protein
MDVAVVVEVEFFDDGDYSEQGTVSKIKDAVTEWVCKTDEGMALWEYSCEDLNIGDLLCDGFDSLMPFLNKRGIKSVDGFQLMNEVPYDTVLGCRASIDQWIYEKETDTEAYG